MRIKLLDTQTGKTRVIYKEFDAFWWAEGNGSCDCNRKIFFYDEDIDIKQKHCTGTKRFLITEIDSIEYTLNEFNYDYPEELKNKYLK